jgi:branched-chain amino acid transport system permease protein
LTPQQRASETGRGGARRAAFIGAVAAGVLLPFCVEGFTVYQFTIAGVYAIAILGLNLLTGFTGQFSLGQGAFYGLGGYTAAILMERWGVSAYPAIPAAGVVCFAAGFLFGLPTARLKFLHLVLATYALATVMPRLLKSSHFERLTGGVQGIYVDRPGPPVGLPLTDDQWWYFVTLAILALLCWLARNLVTSRSGRALVAIREHPIAARSMGINVGLYKCLVFGVSALCAGVAGALGTIRMDLIAPDSFTLWLSILLLIGAVAGGVRSVPGAILGGLFIQFLPTFADMVSKDLAQVVYGLMLLAAIWVMPSGAAGFMSRLSVHLRPRADPARAAPQGFGGSNERDRPFGDYSQGPQGETPVGSPERKT